MKVLLLIAVLMLSLCGGGGTSSGDWYDANDPVSNTVHKSLLGASVVGHKGTPVDWTMLQQVDKGLARLASVVDFNYQAKVFPAGYFVELVSRSPKCTNPGYTLKPYQSSQYDGTVFDKDSRPGWVELCIAGQYHGKFRGNLDFISVVSDVNTTALVTYYEGEHSELSKHDPAKFEATKYHQSGGHPIIPQPPSAMKPQEAKAASFIQDGKRITVILTE